MLYLSNNLISIHYYHNRFQKYFLEILQILFFEYDIIEIPEEIVNKQYADEEGKEFETLIGDILIEVIQENIEVTESEDGKNRRYDFKEPIIQ